MVENQSILTRNPIKVLILVNMKITNVISAVCLDTVLVAQWILVNVSCLGLRLDLRNSSISCGKENATTLWKL